MSTEFLMVPVPADRVAEVYRLLASVPAQPANRSLIGSHEDSARAWGDDDIAQAYRESSERMKRFLDYLAAMPDQPASADETAQAVDYSRHQQAGMLGAFGHRVKARYGRATWFFEYSWSQRRGAWAYTMPATAASVIREIAGG